MAGGLTINDQSPQPPGLAVGEVGAGEVLARAASYALRCSDMDMAMVVALQMIKNRPAT